MSTAEAAPSSDPDRELLERVRAVVGEALRGRDHPDEGGPEEGPYSTVYEILGDAAQSLERLLLSGSPTEELRMTEETRRRFESVGELAQEFVQNSRLRGSMSLYGGTYYASVDQVWTARPASYARPELFRALRRPKAPSFVAQSVARSRRTPGTAVEGAIGSEANKPTGAEPVVVEVVREDVYAKTRAHAANPDYEAAVAWDRAAEVGTEPEGADDPPPPDEEQKTPSSPPPPSNRSSVVWQSSEASSSHPTYPPDVNGHIWSAGLMYHRIPSDPLVGLIPTCPDKAALYYDVAACALGLGDDGNDDVSVPWEVLQKAIFGSRTKKEKQGSGGRGEDDCDDGWVEGTGLKKIVPNKILLPGALHFFDRNPCVLIVPVMDLDEMKAWSGGPYKAIVLPGAWPGTFGPITPKLICATIEMQDAAETASPSEVEQARILLECVVLGLAHSQHLRLSKHESKLTSTQRAMLHRRLEGFRTIPGAPESVYVPEAVLPPQSALAAPVPTASLRPSATAAGRNVAPSSAEDEEVSDATAAAVVAAAAPAALPPAAACVSEEQAQVLTETPLSSPVPSKVSSANESHALSSPEKEPTPTPAVSKPLRVRLVEFQGASSNDDADTNIPGHPAPDPLLLAVRAAVNWSWRNHQKLLESGEPEPEMHPLSVQAMEEYLAERDEAIRAETMEDVATGLGQPDGYQGGEHDDVDNDNEELGSPDGSVADVADLYDDVP